MTTYYDSYYMRHIFFILSLFFFTSLASAREILIESSAQLSGAGDSFERLVDSEEDGVTNWFGNVLRVSFPNSLLLNQDEDIVVYLKRSVTDASKDVNIKQDSQPTTLKIEGRKNGGSWENVAYAYFLYRGQGTKEYSSRIHFDGEYDELQITATATNSHSADGNMRMSEFNIIKLGKDENYSNKFADRFHLVTDYRTGYDGFEFRPTNGFIDDHNFPKDEEQWSESLRNAWANGQWTKNASELKKAGVSMPNFSMLTPGDDPDIVSGERQRTHVVEHELYAVPGDAICLYPFYGLKESPKFEENFSHWYDYTTGGSLTMTDETGQTHQLLDFLTDPSQINKTSDIGFLGGSALPYVSNNWSRTLYVNSEQDYIDYVKMQRDGNNEYNIVLMNDLDFSGYSEDAVEPLGTLGNPFCGVFDGRGHTIRNLKMRLPGWTHVGIIGKAGGGAKIVNLNIDESCSFEGAQYVAPVGYFEGIDGETILISNLYSAATVVADNYAAGILGFVNPNNQNITVTISDCGVKSSVYAPISQTDKLSKAAGIVCVNHVNSNGLVEVVNTYFDGNVEGYLDNSWYSEALHMGYNVTFKNCFTSFRSNNTNIEIRDFPLAADYQNELTTSLLAKGWSYENYDLKYQYYAPQEDPDLILREIRTPEDFIQVCYDTRTASITDKYHIVLMNDIDLAGYEDQFEPMGNKDKPFCGIFDGKGYTIKNLKTRDEIAKGWWWIGLIGYASDGAQVLNVTLDESCSIRGGQHVGVIGYIKMEKPGGSITIAGVNNRGYVNAAINGNKMAGGLIGNNESDSNTFLNIVGCSVSGAGNEGLPQIGCTGNSATVIKESFFVWGNETSPLTKNSYNVTYEDCFTTTGGSLPTGVKETEVTYAVSYAKMADELGGQWRLIEESPMPKVIDTPEAEVKQSVYTTTQPRQYGTVATFFYPRDVNSEDGLKLGFPEGTDEFIIAADFSQSFDAERNIDFESKTIYEPTIQFRHIFRIKDGVKFADEFSGSAKQNKDYVSKHKRYVTARAGVNFQIRYDSPVPKYYDNREPVRSTYYYKISDSDYRRVCGMDVRVTDLKTNKSVEGMFFSDFTYEGQFGEGTREIEGITYFTGDAGGEYARFLKCYAANAKAGTYKVELIGKDYNNETITVCGSTDELVVQEFEITFVDDKSASVVKDSDLKESTRFKHCFESELKRRYGNPVDVINFDEYAELEKLIGKEDMKYYIHTPYLDEYSFNDDPKFQAYLAEQLKTYKGLKVVNWPVEWNSSNYIFGYNRRHDYSMYMVTNHVAAAPYHGAAVEAYSLAENFPNAISTAAEGDGTGSIVQGGMYDRLFYDTRQTYPDDPSKWKEGYFYYVNAATDPGVMSVLELPGFCPGSAIYISAWVSECSLEEEVANIAFNLTAVLTDGTRIPVHSFVTGYISDMNTEEGTVYSAPTNKTNRAVGNPYGRWMNVYYTFIPKLDEVFSRLADLDMTPLDVRYELELDNNCTNSLGADYAIDDIEVYLVNTAVYATQEIQLCEENSEDISVNIESSFRVLLSNAGLEEKDAATKQEENAYIFYTIIDKEKYDELIEGGKSIQEALEGSVKMQGGDGQKFSSVEFSPYFDGNKEENGLAIGKEIDGDKYLTFKATITDDNVRVGKEYQVIFYVTQNFSDSDQLSLEDMFSPEDNCAKKGIFKINGNGHIKIDGEMRSANEAFSVCENQSPVVQVDLWGMPDEGGKMTELEKNAIFDWYYGTKKEFEAEQKGDTYLKNALDAFRLYYPDAESLFIQKETEDGDIEIVKISYDATEAEDLTQAMIDYLEEMTSGNNPKLRLYQSSFVFPPVKLPEGVNETSDYVLAIPIEGLNQYEGMRICTAPTEIKIDIAKRSPMISHGLTQITSYPEDMTDVPLRVGLRQLKNVRYGDSKAFTEGAPTLQIPIKSVVNQNGTVQSMRKVANPSLVIVETNDPEYKNLGLDSDEDSALLEVGEIRELTAEVEGSGNLFSVTYYDDFNFKEGYYYRFRFSFEEDSEEEDENVCSGQDVFTIKVVPEFQKWVGNDNLNWNNDDNWQRVNYNDLYVFDKDVQLDEYVTDGVANPNIRSYAPLDFTKVIMPRAEELGDDKRFSALYGMTTTDMKGFADLPSTNNEVKWPEKTDVPEDMTVEVGDATIDIQYDMAAYNPDGSQVIKCRPWYANTCEQINFRPNSEILNQHQLSYQKAWIELEIDAQRWYTLAVPLKDVYAGDMYLPSATGRQETRLFEDITFEFESGEYNRFKPAVYQRGWNKASAKVYELPSTNGGTGSDTNVAVKADWSNVYNDVTEQYGAGLGFSVKADTSALEDEPESVLFRFPKADSSYTYYNMDGSITGNTTTLPNMTEGMRSTHSYRLNDGHGTITSDGVQSGKYFLIGNPFICHLDMKKFLENNKDLIAPKYWMVTKDMQTIGFSQDGSALDGGTIAPLQGFFVEVLESLGEKSSLELSYDESMMCFGSFDASTSSPLRVASENQMITVTASNGGEISSMAAIIVDECASKGYSEDEDMTVFDNSEIGVHSTVYTVAGNRAVSCNVTDSIEEVEIGLISNEDVTTTLQFSGIPTYAPLYLHDTADNTYTELYDGFEYVAKGAVNKRLYLVSAIPSLEEEISEMRMSRSGHSFTIYSGGEAIIKSISVTNSQGMRVKEFFNVEDMIEFTLDSGIFVIVADDGRHQLVRKVIVK